MILDTLVVHPAYWKRGHGTALAKWTNVLADWDDAGLAVAAARMGAEFFPHVGYKLKELVEVKGYDRHNESIYSWFGHRDSSRRHSSVEAVL